MLVHIYPHTHKRISIYIHISVYAHIHIQVYSLMKAHTHTRMRICARMRTRIHTTHTSARAQTGMHSDTRGPNHARTHAPAHEHACMCMHTCNTPAHPCMRRHTRHAHARRHMHAGTCTHAPAQMHMHAYARARANTHAQSARPRATTPTYFCCALADWGHTPQL